MHTKKNFRTYYLLLAEGTTEFNLFAYLTKVKFQKLFADSNVRFSDKVNIIKDGKQIVSQGKLDGMSGLKDFKAKNELIKERYEGQKLFFMIDKDLDDSSEIGNLIKQNQDVVQFVEYNSEYILLKFAGKNLKEPQDFPNLKNFRDYCKEEFQKQFKKKASEFKDSDFGLIFSSIKDTEIHKSFNALFSLLSS